MLNNKIICYIGVMGSGKTYSCEQLTQQGNFKKISFGDELREFLWDILGWKPANDKQYDLFKKRYMCPQLIDGTDSSAFEINGRQLLQNLGTEAMRKREPNFWLNCWKNKVLDSLKNKSTNICCDDIRFLNELKTAHELGARIVFVDYHSDRYELNNHESEKLAQFLIYKGFEHNQELTEEDIQMIYKEFPNWYNFIIFDNIEGE